MNLLQIDELSILKVLLAIFAFLSGVLFGHLLLNILVIEIFNRDKMAVDGTVSVSNPLKRDRYSIVQSGILGIIERSMYIIAFLMGQWVFIGAWFTLKTIVPWNSWKEKEGRRKFNNFLIGNGLSLIFSFGSFWSIKVALGYWYPLDLLQYSLGILAPIFLSLTLYWYFYSNIPEMENDFKDMALKPKSKKKVRSYELTILRR